MGSPTVVVSPARRSPAQGFFQSLSRISLAIESRPAAAFFALTLFYAAAVLILSSFKLLWLDELITLHIARLPTAAAIWQALANGADPNPPVTHLLVHLSRNLFGEHEAALRLPAMAGYWIGLLSLFLFLRRRASATWALAGTVLSMAMAAFDYSYESRSYAIFYGLAMLAFLLWSLASDPALSPAKRRLALLGTVLTLALGVCTNYFAVVAFLPIAAGELARTLARTFPPSRIASDSLDPDLFNPDSFDPDPLNPDPLDRPRLKASSNARLLHAIDLRVWLGLVLAATPLLLFRQNIQHSIAQFAPHAWNKVSLDQVSDSYTQMVESVLMPLLALFAFAAVLLYLTRFAANSREDLRPRWLGRLVAAQMSLQTSRSHRALPLHEAVGVLFLMLYPILGYIVASVHGGMLSPRFVIPVCFGFAIAGTLTVRRIFGHLPYASASLLLLVLAWYIARESTVGFWYLEQKQCFYKVLATLPETEYRNDPIVIPDPLMVLTFQHYAPPEMAARIVFPLDFPAICLYRGDDSPEQNLWAGRNTLYHLPILTLAGFEHHAGRYLILASDGNWLHQDLLHHRYPVQRLDINTRAGAIGGFTPLMRGTPVFFASAGDEFFRAHPNFPLGPLPFKRFANLPGATLAPSEGGPFPKPETENATQP